MGQDSFIHETTPGNINNPKGENLTIFRRSDVARNAPDATAPFQVRHPDGVDEPIIGAGGVAPFYYGVTISGEPGVENTSMVLTALPSVGAVGDYVYAWSLHSNNIAGTSVNPVLGVPAANVVTVTNPSFSEAEGMVKCLSLHIATGAIAENYFWLTLEQSPPP